eukprot:509855-Prorocentrum_minimum.AAC.1
MSTKQSKRSNKDSAKDDNGKGGLGSPLWHKEKLSSIKVAVLATLLLNSPVSAQPAGFLLDCPTFPPSAIDMAEPEDPWPHRHVANCKACGELGATFQCKYQIEGASAWQSLCAYCGKDNANLYCCKCKYPDLVYCSTEHMVRSIFTHLPSPINFRPIHLFYVTLHRKRRTSSDHEVNVSLHWYVPIWRARRFRLDVPLPSI